MAFPIFAKRVLCILLVLIFCFVSVMTPLRVQALELVSASVIGVSAFLVVGAILMGCGLLPGADSSAFNSLANSIAGMLDTVWYLGGVATTGMLSVLSFGNNIYVDQRLVADVLGLIHSSGVVSSSSVLSATFDASLVLGNYTLGYFVNRILFDAKSDIATMGWRYAVLVYDSGAVSIYFSSAPFEQTFTGSGTIQVSSSATVYRRTFIVSNASKYNGVYSAGEFFNISVSGNYIFTTLSALYTAIEGFEVAEIDVDLESDIYYDWTSSGTSSYINPDSDPSGGDSQANKYLSLYLTSEVAELLGKTQEEIQKGGVSVLDPEDVVETDTEVELDPDTVPEDLKDSSGGGGSSSTGTSGGSSGNGTFESSGTPDPDRFKFDLKTLFPFCIPFDLYAMLQALQADPVAPSFTLGIPFLGEVYTFEVDLSAWDEIASVLRHFQVLLFCIGLTQATRKYIKW